jgi:hypothetical protein
MQFDFKIKAGNAVVVQLSALLHGYYVDKQIS